MIKILIAEDEQIEREFIANIVKTSQPEICCCRRKTGRRRFGVSEHQPEIVFLDINMPVYNGLEVLQRSAPFPGRPARCSS
ncbi:MAG: response regulator transcription factor [Merdibacter sp.]